MTGQQSPLSNSLSEPVARKGFFRRHLFLSVFLFFGVLALPFAGYVAYLTVSLPSVEYLRSTNPDPTSLMRLRVAK